MRAGPNSLQATCHRSLCRPFDPDKITNTSGSFNWVGVPQSILLNGHGFYGDCALLDGGNFLVDPKCNVTRQWVPPGRSSVLPYNAPSNPGAQPCLLGCQHLGQSRSASSRLLL